MERKDILLIDDDINNRILLEKLIRSKGFSIETIGDYKRVKDILCNYTPKILIIDFFLPDKTGIEVISELRDSYDLSSSLVIIATAKSIGYSEKSENEKKYDCIILDKIADKNRLFTLIENKLKKE